MPPTSTETIARNITAQLEERGMTKEQIDEVFQDIKRRVPKADFAKINLRPDQVSMAVVELIYSEFNAVAERIHQQGRRPFRAIINDCLRKGGLTDAQIADVFDQVMTASPDYRSYIDRSVKNVSRYVRLRISESFCEAGRRMIMTGGTGGEQADVGPDHAIRVFATEAFLKLSERTTTIHQDAADTAVDTVKQFTGEYRRRIAWLESALAEAQNEIVAMANAPASPPRYSQEWIRQQILKPDTHVVVDVELAEAIGRIVTRNYYYFKDGDQWCCVFHSFTNLQESPAGFGVTPMLAWAALMYTAYSKVTPLAGTIEYYLGTSDALEEGDPPKYADTSRLPVFPGKRDLEQALIGATQDLATLKERVAALNDFNHDLSEALEIAAKDKKAMVDLNNAHVKELTKATGRLRHLEQGQKNDHDLVERLRLQVVGLQDRNNNQYNTLQVWEKDITQRVKDKGIKICQDRKAQADRVTNTGHGARCYMAACNDIANDIWEI